MSHRERPRTIRLGWLGSAVVFLLTAGAVRGGTPTPQPLSIVRHQEGPTP